MKHFTHSLFFALTCLMVQTAFSSDYPKGCSPEGFSFLNQFVVLNLDGNQTFYLMKNNSHAPIILERHETRKVFMSPKLEAKINPNHWAAFSSDIKEMHFKCFSTHQEEKTQIPCRDVLDVCQYPRVKFALSNMGNYWVSINGSQKRVMREAISKGILLRW